MLLGDFNANTGVDDIKGIGNIRKWNHVSRTNYFEGKCADLSGSSGDFFPPFITKNQTMELFSPEMCRSVLMDFEEEKEIKGVKTFKFSGGDRTVDNGTLYPENECYCGGVCVPSGLFNVSSCRYGTPVFMSFPHFYNADPFYHEKIEGMKPDKDKHQFFMSFEPVRLHKTFDGSNLFKIFPQKTAIPLEVAARFQINLLVSPIPKITIYEKVQRKFMPILWFEQHVKMSEDIANEVKMILKLPRIGQIMGIALIAIGIAQIFVLPIVKFISRVLCPKRSKISDKNNKHESIDVKAPPEIFPLITEKPKNGISLIGVSDKGVFRD